MKRGTGTDVLKAYNTAVRRLEGKRGAGLNACAVSAGFIFVPGQKPGARRGYQVFVKVCRYSDKLLLQWPQSGGLFVGV